MTQSGIVERTGIARSNVSTELHLLAKKGLVGKRVGYVEGDRRPKAIYFLTREGSRLASDLKETAAPPASHPASLPSPRSFVGRQEEWKAVRDWMRTERPRAMYVEGMAGIGKTTLLLKAAETARPDTGVFYFRFRRWSDLRHLLLELGTFLAMNGRTGLSAMLGPESGEIGPVDRGAAIFQIRRDLQGLRCLLILDDLHDSAPEPRDFLSVLLETAAASEARVLAAGRERVPPFDARAARTGTVRLLRLSGLDEDGVRALLSARRSAALDPGEAERARVSTAGNPLLIELLTDPAGLTGQGDVREFLRREVDERLGPAERRVIRRLSAFREPVPADAFLDPEDVAHLDSLVTKALVEPDEGRQRYSIHDALREHFYGSLDSSGRAEVHGAAARFYAGREDAEGAVEALRHLWLAGDSSRVRDSVAAKGPGLAGGPGAGALVELIGMMRTPEPDPSLDLVLGSALHTTGDAAGAGDAFQRVTSSSRDPAQRLDAWEGLVQSVLSLGELDRAERVCREGLREASMSRKRRGRGSFDLGLTRQLGTILLYRFKFREAIGVLEECARRASRARDPGLMAYCHGSLGNALRESGQPRQAQRHFARALRCTPGLDDPRLEARILVGMGVTSIELGDYDRALDSLGEALRTADRCGFRDIAGFAASDISRARGFRGEHDLAKEYARKALELAREARLPRLEATALVYLADACIESGDAAAALAHLKEAERAAGERPDPSVELNICYYSALAQLRLGDLAAAAAWLRRGFGVRGSARSPSVRATLLIAQAELQRARGEVRGAALSAAKSVGLLEASGTNFGDRARATELAGTVHAELGERAKAVRLLSAAGRMYRRMGHAAGSERCRALLASRPEH
jgi:tetratricopeptide (TPR) repeat protein/DNA-binding PadR family transcriptional regulator